MSVKVAAFSTLLPVPKTLEKFFVLLPGSPQSLFRVSASSLPYSNHGEGAIWLFGRPFYIPTDKQSTGEWTCTLLEDVVMLGDMTITTLEHRINNKAFRPGDVKILITDQVSGAAPQLLVTLKYAWLKSVTPVRLDWSRPTESLSYNLTFRYNGIKRWF